MDVSYPKAPAITGKSPEDNHYDCSCFGRALKQPLELKQVLNGPMISCVTVKAMRHSDRNSCPAGYHKLCGGWDRINVNLSVRDFPEDIRNIATSIKIEKGREFRRSDILQAVLENMEDMYLNYFDDDNFERLLQEYRDYSVVLGKKYRLPDRPENLAEKPLILGKMVRCLFRVMAER